MKLLSYLIIAIDYAAIIFGLINGIILLYGITQQYPYSEFTLLFLCLVAGFGTDHWRKRKLNNRILNPYHDGRK